MNTRAALPLSPIELAILLLLDSGGAAYGYGIVKGIAASSMGSIRLAPGNLYQVLDRLLERGWIESASAPAGEDQRRRYYAVTARGRAVAAAEAARLRGMLPTLERLHAVRGRGV
jgi:DNA-binding PadR family transcriptional regulator